MKTNKPIAFLFAAGAVASLSAVAASDGQDQVQNQTPYAGQETRAIKSLSPKDIEDLKNGRGWGLAKAAELNGMPGPAHLLEMKDKIGLTAVQVNAIQKLFDAMKTHAVPLGKQLVALESVLNKAFAHRKIDEKSLKVSLGRIGKVRSELRFVHLSTHLKTLDILSATQVDHYNRLRGYKGSAKEDPKDPGHH